MNRDYVFAQWALTIVALSLALGALHLVRHSRCIEAGAEPGTCARYDFTKPEPGLP